MPFSYEGCNHTTLVFSYVMHLKGIIKRKRLTLRNTIIFDYSKYVCTLCRDNCELKHVLTYVSNKWTMRFQLSGLK